MLANFSSTDPFSSGSKESSEVFIGIGCQEWFSFYWNHPNKGGRKTDREGDERKRLGVLASPHRPVPWLFQMLQDCSGESPTHLSNEDPVNPQIECRKHCMRLIQVNNDLSWLLLKGEMGITTKDWKKENVRYHREAQNKLHLSRLTHPSAC